MNRISAITCAAMCLFFSCGAAAQEADNQKGVLSGTVLLGEKEPETEQLLIQKETGNKTTASGTSDETEEWTPAGKPPASQILTVAMECDFAPYNWEQNTAENGAVPIHYEDSYAFGYDVLVAQKICETYGWQLEILKFNWDALVPAVVSGTVDCAIAGQSVTDDRLSYVDFTQPYYRASIVAVTREGSDYADAQTLSDLTGASCSSQENTVWYDECLQQIADAKIKEATEDVKEMFDGLDKEEYDIVVTDEPTALAACAEYPGLKILDFSGTDDDFEMADEEVNVAISVKKGDTKLKNQINAVLAKMTAQERTELMSRAIEVQPYTIN